MSAALAAHVLPESQYGDWHALLAASAQGSVYAMPEYLEALCEAAGGSYRVFAAHRGDELAGGVAVYERAGPRGLRVSPRLLLYYNGVVLREYPTKYPSQRTARLLETSAALEAALAGARYDGIVLKCRSSFSDARVFMQQGWSVRPGYSYVVRIDDLPAAWQRMEQNLRRLVNRCANEGLVLAEDNDFASFLRLHEQTIERKGTPQYLPGPAFARFFARLRAAGLAKLFHARLPDGRAVASQLVLLGPFATSHSVGAATDAAHRTSGATAFLRWKVFEALSALGYAANDLTDAALNPVAHFKSQLGGDLALCLVMEKAPAPRPWPRRAWQGLRAMWG